MCGWNFLLLIANEKLTCFVILGGFFIGHNIFQATDCNRHSATAEYDKA